MNNQSNAPKDVTELFAEDSPEKPGNEDPDREPLTSLPGFDPLGIVERWTDGRISDPLRKKLLDFFERRRS